MKLQSDQQQLESIFITTHSIAPTLQLQQTTMKLQSDQQQLESIFITTHSIAPTLQLQQTAMKFASDQQQLESNFIVAHSIATTLQLQPSNNPSSSNAVAFLDSVVHQSRGTICTGQFERSLSPAPSPGGGLVSSRFPWSDWFPTSQPITVTRSLSESLTLSPAALAGDAQAQDGASTAVQVGSILAGVIVLGALLFLFLLKKRNHTTAAVQETTELTTIDDGDEYISEYGLSDAGDMHDSSADNSETPSRGSDLDDVEIVSESQPSDENRPTTRFVAVSGLDTYIRDRFDFISEYGLSDAGNKSDQSDSGDGSDYSEDEKEFMAEYGLRDTIETSDGDSDLDFPSE
jgi:hypothetical protein